MTKFKVGDKVRILDVKSIDFGRKFWLNGDVTKVTDVEVDGGVYLATPCSKGRGLYVTKAELRYIDLVPHSSTKNQRLTDAEHAITTLEQNVVSLESEVAELKAKVEALEKAQLSGPGTVYLHGKPIGKIDAIAALSKSPNKQRKAIIAEAKAFVAENTKYNARAVVGDGIRISPWVCVPEFIVNEKKRAVTVLFRLVGDKSCVHRKGIAKCAPDDVFNADIGKAIALGRALGLDVSRFEQAVKPTEVVVGQTFKVTQQGVVTGKVAQVTRMYPSSDGVFGKAFKHTIDSGWLGDKQVAIIDDTEAKY